jgi:hypothetical protein
MKKAALALLLIASVANADTLVDAAKASKAKRRKSTSRVLTNSDVKKAKGTLVQSNAAARPVDAVPEESLVEMQEAMRKERTERAEALRIAEANVAQLEKELAAIEQQYYEENDLDRRDREVVKRFNDTKKKLDAAREELAGITERSAVSSKLSGAPQPTVLPETVPSDPES